MWLYHGTTMENIPTIIKHGLLPARSGEHIQRSWFGRQYHREGLFVAPTEDAAMSWANFRNHNLFDRYDVGEPVVLRFRWNGPLEDDLVLARQGQNGWIIKVEVPSNQLQIRAGAPTERGPWESLATWARSG